MLEAYNRARAVAGGPPLWLGVLIAGSVPVAAFGLAALLAVVGRLG